MQIEIPVTAIQLAIDAHCLTKWSFNSIEWRALAVQKLEYQFSQIVMGIIIKEYTRKVKLLPK